MAIKEQVDLVLSTLSFFEPMSLERIIFDFDEKKVLAMKDFSNVDLENILKQLLKEKKIKKIKKGSKVEYQRIHPKRGWRKIFDRIFSL
jgi:regulatory protein YycH of two-component signal transduction system YycFG